VRGASDLSRRQKDVSIGQHDSNKDQVRTNDDTLAELPSKTMYFLGFV
jgi:hypothetical protein